MPYDKAWKAGNSKSKCNTVNRYNAFCQATMKYADSAKYAAAAAFAYNGYNFVNSDTCTAKFANGSSDYMLKPTTPSPHDDDEGDDDDGGHNGHHGSYDDDGDDDSDDFAYLLALPFFALFL
jgi:hypothetical protein